MVMGSKFSNCPNELSENDELREFELSGSNCTRIATARTAVLTKKLKGP